jgi:hypothetical protein
MKLPMTDKQLNAAIQRSKQLVLLMKKASKDNDERRIRVLSRLIDRQVVILFRNNQRMLESMIECAKIEHERTQSATVCALTIGNSSKAMN